MTTKDVEGTGHDVTKATDPENENPWQDSWSPSRDFNPRSPKYENASHPATATMDKSFKRHYIY
jgi:hypothetical protein